MSPLESDEWTWGELLCAVEGERERCKQRSVIAYHQAVLSARCLTGGQLPEVWEVFPFWTEEEKKQQQAAHYRAVMEQYAAAGRRKDNE